jgi:DNA polymerase III delta' subunit
MSISWKNCAGQTRVTGTLTTAMKNDKLGHAYLFSGDAGVGKFPVALNFAQAILCESEEKPCGVCDSCLRVKTHSHPDFRYLFPIPLSAEHKIKAQPGKLSEDGWEFVGDSIKEKISKPYSINHSYEAAVAVDWIREVNSSINRGSSDAGKTVVIIEGIDHFRKEAANAMLKTLEEPPPETVIILIARSLHATLPTIRSRCQIHRFGLVDNGEISKYLFENFEEKEPSEIEEAVNRCEGSVGKAIEILENDSSVTIPSLFKMATSNFSPFELTHKIEQLVEEDFGGSASPDYELANRAVRLFLEDVRTSFLGKYGSEAECILDSSRISHKNGLSSEQAEKFTTCCESAFTSIKRHSPLLMVFVELLIKISEIINES